MSEEYIEYWGLKQHPFLLAPDSNMMHMAGQYYECLERLKYAVNTNKGGALVVSEDAGLGKTTILLKLINEMREIYGNAFKYAFVDHPTLTSNQLIAYIAGCFTDATPNEDNKPRNLTIDFIHNRMQIVSDLSHNEDKLKNLMILKEALIEVKQQGGKSIIIVDEGQMLCGAQDILQELRILINLTFKNEYLHTFILSGQRPLWNEVKSMPEFWQRLPVRYYFVPLQIQETKELIKYRLMRAGLNDKKEIFTDDALEIIQRYSMGSPRTIIAMSDLSLLIGFADRSSKIGFKEMSKVINAMSGRGDSLAYIKEEKTKKETMSDNLSGINERKEIIEKKIPNISVASVSTNEKVRYETKIDHVRPFFAVLAVLFAIIAGFAVGYYITFGVKEVSSIMPAKKEVEAISTVPAKNEIMVKADVQPTQEVQENNTQKPEQTKREEPVQVETPKKYEKEALIIASGANVRSAPDINAARIALIFEGETVKIVDEKKDITGKKWFRLNLYGNREGWVSQDVLSFR
ncbi:MAG: SH3 domain-containing protein [Proteobacteria bacterium]|nr:SH3 domain-containing protein [Pseudomonadota bacterium]